MTKTAFFKAIITVIHVAVLAFIIFSMLVWVSVHPFVEGINETVNIIDVEKVASLKHMGYIGFISNIAAAVAAIFFSKPFFVIHAVLAEFCLLHTLTLFIL